MTIHQDTATATDPLQEEWAAWHRAHEEKRADRHGFLAITGLHFLDEEPRSFPDAPGEWTSTEDGVVVDLGPGESLDLAGQQLTGRHSFGVLPERGGVTVHFGDIAIEVAKRGGYDIVRPRHPDNPVRTAYLGTEAFPVRASWRIQAHFTPYAEPAPTRVDGLEHVYDAVGEVGFERAGAHFTLLAFPGHADGELLILFSDATAGVTTHPAVRSLTVTPDAAGRVVLDFNRATNLPCAYTQFATCPLPPPANKLSLAVTAGERLPR
ncbi:DUF1684 domain-containing protein [Flexivirga sp. ID2601S]|uniref:DUF1684 domain-containing protein n=1 Tax=Flexivirga aerilata TaxID=1656889 RepID=A0A849AHN9_9MICO|nr:DUF1684 domain-containing protein [Flexivirga aerilata]NNG39076.1 DUF1684 domain-containing protein [Flexivirga aerilata]